MGVYTITSVVATPVAVVVTVEAHAPVLIPAVPIVDVPLAMVTPKTPLLAGNVDVTVPAEAGAPTVTVPLELPGKHNGSCRPAC